MSVLTRFLWERSVFSCLAAALLAFMLSAVARAQCGDEVVLKTLDSGTSGPVLLTPKGAPVIGGDFSLRLNGGAPFVVGFVIYSAFENPVVDPLFGATVWPATPWFSKPFVTNMQGKSPPLFNAAVVTDDLCGVQATFQALVADTGAPGAFSITNAVRLRVGSATQPLFVQESLATDGTETPRSLGLGDMNEDGIRDLVSLSNSTVWVRPGLLGGGFGAELKTALTAFGLSFFDYMDLADFDGNGHLDLVRKVTGGLAFAFGNGAGGFTGEFLCPVATPISLAHVGDLNNDGDLDVVAAGEGGTANKGGRNVSVLLGTNSGFFAFPVSYAAVASPDNGLGADVGAADLDEDGDLDLLVAMALGGSNGVHSFKTSVLEGVGDGTFRSPVSFEDTTAPGSSTATRVVSLALADFDGDTLIDVATTFEVNRRVYRRLGSGDLSFGPVEEYPVGEEPHEVAVADVDDDGVADLLAPGTKGRATSACCSGMATDRSHRAELSGPFSPLGEWPSPTLTSMETETFS